MNSDFDKRSLPITPSSPQDNEFIDDKIVEYNNQQVPFTQKEPFINIGYVIKDQAGIIIGGITATIYCWNILYIGVLWVDENHRVQGLGTQLLKNLEHAAHGCTLAHLDTFDFQAKDFYLKHGYEIFGELQDCPPGHTKYFMKKTLR